MRVCFGDYAREPHVVSVEGTRSYGVGLARAVAAAGLILIACEEPMAKPAAERTTDPTDAQSRC